MSGTLDHTPDEIIQDMLIDLGHAFAAADTLLDWTGYIGNLPDEPDKALSVNNTAGRISGKTHPTGETQEHYGIQILVRSDTVPTGFGKARDIFEEFDTLSRVSVTVDSTTYLVAAVTNVASILALGQEAGATRRRLWSVNALAAIRKTS